MGACYARKISIYHTALKEFILLLHFRPVCRRSIKWTISTFGTILVQLMITSESSCFVRSLLNRGMCMCNYIKLKAGKIEIAFPTRKSVSSPTTQTAAMICWVSTQIEVCFCCPKWSGEIPQLSKLQLGVTLPRVITVSKATVIAARSAVSQGFN